MIVFEVIQNDRAGTIVHKLAALIKESRVIFIGFDHEKLRLGQASRMSEILRNTADQKLGFNPQSSKIQASIELVVVLPCVPATAST